MGAGLPAGACIERDPELAEVLELIADGTFTHGDTEVLRPVLDNLIYDDPFLVLADYRSYVDCQARVGAAWRDPDTWSHMSILNAARSGKSSDRAIAEVLRRDLERPADVGAAGLSSLRLVRCASSATCRPMT